MDISRRIESSQSFLAYRQNQNESWRRMAKGCSFSFKVNSCAHHTQESKALHTKSACVQSSPKGVCFEMQHWNNKTLWPDEFLFDAVNDLDVLTIKGKSGVLIWHDLIEDSCAACYQLVVPSGVEMILQEQSLFQSGMRRLDIIIEEGAVLHHSICANVQQESYDFLNVVVHKNAKYEQHFAVSGSQSFRRVQRVRLEEGSTAIVEGCLISKSGARIEDQVLFQHIKPSASSRHHVKTVVAANAISDVCSFVDVSSCANMTQSRQNIEHLMLEDSARVFSKPSLKVRVDDVDCQHGAISRVLQQDLFFYMLSRGLDIQTAKQMYIQGYIKDAVSHMSHYSNERYKYLAKEVSVPSE